MSRQRSLVTSSAVVAASLALALASCSTHSDPPGPVRSDAVSISTPTTPSQVRTPAATPTPAPSFDVAHDRGPASGATGTVVTNAEGVPTSYTVASGDTQGDICHRLGVRWWQLKSGGQFLGTYPDLTVGEVIDVVDMPESAAGDVSSNNALC
ncbi:hypothetical protein AX769_10070 [Frondihabitans sp. PAMC 28766]|uniref:hypothetical protein n=1 Tax=Frondihabitans sp. PAMC 28766 TaxID=1795630 RepID=UPI00078CA049|nr:hypothetical protein [Frondihabitans sp. PAMC 28766]AMM20433.1 hypothetical protein AX769_10070 [Frondihabitans sp. PAMC 28766]